MTRVDLLTGLFGPFRNLLKRELGVQELAVVLAVMLVAGTLYCQLWCLIALQKLHGGTMPLGASLHRAVLDIVPAVAAFELSKRVPLGRRWSLPGIVAIFAAALAAAVAMRLTATVMTSHDPSIRLLAAHRIGPLAAAAAALAWYQLRKARSAGESSAAALFPPFKAIDLVKSAGNYVEVRFAGRNRLLRMTLRQVAEQLPSDQFVQVHRSVIVNKAAIASRRGRRGIVLNDGTEIPVGDAFRSNLDGS